MVDIVLSAWLIVLEQKATLLLLLCQSHKSQSLTQKAVLDQAGPELSVLASDQQNLML